MNKTFYNLKKIVDGSTIIETSLGDKHLINKESNLSFDKSNDVITLYMHMGTAFVFTKSNTSIDGISYGTTSELFDQMASQKLFK